MTIKQIIAKYSNDSLTKRLDRLDLELLIALVLKKDRLFILSHPEAVLNKNQQIKLALLIEKRLKHYPLAYLSGVKDFYGLNFKVTPSVLIPRPETELMVDNIIQQIKKEEGPQKNKELEIIDLGTGSGCIIISLAKNLEPSGRNIKYTALDISVAALKIARLNAKNHQLNKKITFKSSNLLSTKIPFLKKSKPLQLIISANLPYLTPQQVKASPSIQKEPKLALLAGADGLKYYRQLIAQLKSLPQHSFTAYLEIDPGQKTKLTRLLRHSWPEASYRFLKDYRGYNRLLIIETASA